MYTYISLLILPTWPFISASNITISSTEILLSIWKKYVPKFLFFFITFIWVKSIYRKDIHYSISYNQLNHYNSLIVSINLNNLIYQLLINKYTYTFDFLQTSTPKQLIPFAHSTKKPTTHCVACTQAVLTFLSSNTIMTLPALPSSRYQHWYWSSIK